MKAGAVERDGTEPPARPTILVVDDVRLFREMEAAFLRHFDCETLTATSGEEALELVIRRRPALVVLDDQMPGMGGIETCRRIKSEPALARTAILMTSSPEIESDCLAAGADAFLAKPMARRDFLAAVRALLPGMRIFRQRRAYVRFPVEIRLEGESLRAESRDLSVSGISLRCEGAPEAGRLVRLRFTLPGETRPIEVEARLRGTPPGGAEETAGGLIGAAFTGLGAKEAARITDLIERIEKDSPQP